MPEPLIREMNLTGMSCQARARLKAGLAAYEPRDEDEAAECRSVIALIDRLEKRHADG